MRLRGLPGLLFLAVLLLFVIPSAVAYYTDWLWFRELGYEGIFTRTLNAQGMVFVGTFTAVYLFLFLNLRMARGGAATKPRVFLGTGADGRPVSLEGRQLAGLAMPIALVGALLLGFANAANWMTWLSFFHATSFNTVDPLFGRDVSFYVFKLPVYQLIRQQAMLTTVVALVGCAVYYVFAGSFVVESRPALSAWPRVRLVTQARRHLSLLSAVILALMAWGAWLEVPTTLLTPTTASVAFGASYSDVYAQIPFIWISFAVLAVGACFAIWQGFGRRGWPLPLAVALYLLVAAAGGIYAGFVQRLVVTPDEQNKEQPFITHHIEATRRSYALDRVEERELSGDAELTAADVVANAETIENVRLWDHEPLLQTFAQIQEIRTYYDFRSIDNDRYRIDGKYRQVMLSARELNTESMPNRSWVNERLTFTHGYGLTLGPVNQVTTEGLPVLFIRDLPPVSTVDLRLDQPSIYFGELSNSYALVNTRQPEFHYPRGDNNEMTFYAGSGGVPVGSLLRRLLFAIRFGSTDILVTNQITRESRILFHRQIADRVNLLAPFLTFDADPYPVIEGGRLFWMQDAYTSTDRYPYAEPITSRQFGTINYIRNSVKIVTDAYNGSVTFYVAEPTDPLVQTIGKIFPGMLKPLEEMAPGLRTHVRYPEDIFRIQAQIFSTYHMTNPQVFYNKEDQWQIPAIENGGNLVQSQPYYTVMRLPGEKEAEFIQMLPFTPRAKDNLASWMVARSDGAHYGHLLAFQFPKQKIVYGPRQIVGRINQDQTISPQITLWNQQGSEVRWGELLVIPINESLIYVRPLYLRSSERGIPELKKVVVAYQSRIVMADTLTQALAQIFGRTVSSGLAPDQLSSDATSIVRTAAEEASDTPAGVTEPVPAAAPAAAATLRTLAAEASSHFENADKALRAGDLSLFQDEVRKAQEAVRRMQAMP